MNRALPRPFIRMPDWRWIMQRAAIVALAVSAWLSLPIIANIGSWSLVDWDTLTEAGHWISEGRNPYSADNSFRWSPLVAWLFVLIEPIGRWGWVGVGFALLLLLRDWRWIGAFLCAFPYWLDMETGLSFAYVPVLMLLAMRGSFAAGVVIFAVAALVPRPVMAPLTVWLLWQRPEIRLPGALVAGVLIVGALFTGWTDEWINELLDIGRSGLGTASLVTVLGPLWLFMLWLSAWLTYRGHLGLAALAISPYFTWAYPMMLLLEIPRPIPRHQSADTSSH